MPINHSEKTELLKVNVIYDGHKILLFGIFTLLLMCGIIQPVLAIQSANATSTHNVVSTPSSSKTQLVSSIVSANNASIKNVISSKSSCPCIVFRLDDIKGLYLPDVQTKIMNEFQTKNASLTIGVVGFGFSADSKLISYLKNNLKPKHALLEIANHGWQNDDFAAHTLSGQISLMNTTNQELQKILGKKPNVFIPPSDLYDNDTLKVLKQLQMNVLSSSIWSEDKFVTVNGKIVANKDSLGIYHVPSMTNFQIDLGNGSYWASIPKGVLISSINSHISKYGYDVILLHPQNFATFVNGKYANTVDKASLDELSSIIDYAKSKHMKIVTLSDIAGLDHVNAKPVTHASNTTSITKPVVAATVTSPITTPITKLDQSGQSPRLVSPVAPNGSLTLDMKYFDQERVGAYMISLQIYQDFNQVPYLKLSKISENPLTVVNLPMYHQYKIKTYVGGMFSSANLVTLDNPEQTLDVNIPEGGAMHVTVYYHDGETPIPNASVSVISQDNKTRETVTTDPDGVAPKFYLPPTTLYGDHYIVFATLSTHLSFSSVPVTLQPGDENDIKLIAPWPPIVQNLVTVKVYNQTQILSSSEKIYAVDMYDDKGTKIVESALNIHGEGYFWSMKIGDYVFKVVNTRNGQVLGNLVVTLDGSKNNFDLMIQNHSVTTKGNLGKGTAT